MAIRRPIVIIDGQYTELPIGDTLASVGDTWDYIERNSVLQDVPVVEIPSGKVWSYTYQDQTIYRFISTALDSFGSPTDAFYADFDGSSLTNLLATR